MLRGMDRPPRTEEMERWLAKNVPPDLPPPPADALVMLRRLRREQAKRQEATV